MINVFHYSFLSIIHLPIIIPFPFPRVKKVMKLFIQQFLHLNSYVLLLLLPRLSS